MSATGSDELFRARVTVGFTIVLAAMVMLMFLSRLAIEGTVSGTLWILLASALLLVLSPFVTKWTQSSKPAAYLLVLMAITVIPLRAWSTGGIDSTVMSWYAIIPLVSWLTLGTRGGLTVTAVSLAEALVIAHPQLLNICAWCRKIHDEDDSWKELEQYVDSHSEAQFSHGICPECAVKHFDELRDDKS